MAAARTRRTARQIQQQLGSLFGARNVTAWDVYTPNDREYLVRKIELLIPNVEGHDENAQKENARLEELRETVATAAWNHRKYNGGDLLMSIIYVLCTKVTEKETDALEETEYSMFSLMRVRKCRGDERSGDYCMIFIDHKSRVYKNWKDYVINNDLPEGVLVAPRNGCYDFNKKDEVLLECAFTPAADGWAMDINDSNKAAGVVTITAHGSQLTIPIADFPSNFRWLMVAKEFSKDLARETLQRRSLFSMHRRGVPGGVLGMGASGATSSMANSAAAGASIPNVTKGVTITTMLVNGVRVYNSTIQKILNLLNGENISAMDVDHLCITLFLVTHSVSNFRITQIFNTSRENAIQNFRSELINRQRKAFNRIYHETVALHDEEAGRVHVLRALNTIPESRQPLNDVNRINRQLNQNNLRASFNLDGKILLKNDLAVDSTVLRQNLQHGIGENIAQRVAPSQSTANTQNINIPSGPAQNIRVNKIVPNRRQFILKRPAPESVRDEEVFLDTINNILEHIPEHRLQDLYTVANDFWAAFSRQFSLALNRFIPLEEVLWRCFVVAREECRNGNIEACITGTHPSVFILKVKRIYENLIPRLGERTKCRVCSGYFYTA